jgi:hypothetical protein
MKEGEALWQFRTINQGSANIAEEIMGPVLISVSTLLFITEKQGYANGDLVESVGYAKKSLIPERKQSSIF